MRALAPALALALAIAGCTFPDLAPAPEDEEEPIERPGDLEGAGPPCGRVTIEAPERARRGDVFDITASLANCGNRTLQIDRGLCPDEGSGFRLTIGRGVNDWHMHARDVYDAAALHDTPCVRGGTSIFGLPPSGGDVEIAHIVTFRWNGTFATDPCWPPEAGGLACLQYAPAAPGDYELRARIGASGVFWESNRTLVVEADGPATNEPCGRASLARDGAALVLTIENCGGTDLTLDPAVACNEGYPAQMRINGRRLGGEEGCAPLVAARVIPSGGLAWARFSGAPPGPGTHEAIALVRALEGWTGEARLSYAVPSE